MFLLTYFGMRNLNTPKKPVVEDWHRADIKAALEKLGYSLSRFSLENGYSRTAAQCALRMEWPLMERLIANTIGVPVQQIWPSRYHPDGSRKSDRRERGIPRAGMKHSTGPARGNVQAKARG